MKSCASYSSCLILVLSSLAVAILVASAAPLDEDEMSENVLLPRGDSSEVERETQWDAINSAALRKLLLQLDAPDRYPSYGFGRVSRSWPLTSGARGPAVRMGPQWRTDKRQVRFRQCYFNPISCFKK